MLAVVDNSSGTDTDEVNITVNENNIAPIANAGINQTVLEFATVTLDGTSSTDVDGTIVSYNWTQVNGTLVTLLNNDTSKPTFEAPDVTIQEILTFMLAVVDNSSGTDTDEVNITVNEDDNQSGGGGSGDDPPVDDGPDEKDGKNKVTICHIPPGNPDNAHTITVGEPAVLTHMTKHGDTIGPCSNSSQNEKSNSGKGNNDDENKPDNSVKGNSDKEKNEKSNSGKGNNGNDDEDKKDNSGKGNSGVNNSGKSNQNDKDENKKSNSGKGNKNDNENKSNSKLKNNNDDEAKVEDNEHEDDDDEDEDEHEDEDEDDGEDEDD